MTKINETKIRIFWLFVVLIMFTISLNIAWAHQTILKQWIPIEDYYLQKTDPPFAYRILPLLIYNLFLGKTIIYLGYNSPFANSAEVFQLILDTFSLLGTGVLLFVIANSYAKIPAKVAMIFTFGYTLLMICFGYFFSPNACLFYPYDFVEIFFFALIVFISTQQYSYSLIFMSITIFFGVMNKETIIFFSLFYIIIKFNNKFFKKETLAICMLFFSIFLLSKSFTIWLAEYLRGSKIDNMLFQNQLDQNIGQLHNPLFYFSMSGIFSYLYLPLLYIRKKLEKIDYLLLSLVVVWFIIMSNVGVLRELRVFTPMCIILFIILVRHFNFLCSKLFFSINATC